VLLLSRGDAVEHSHNLVVVLEQRAGFQLHVQAGYRAARIQDSYLRGDMKMKKWKIALSVLAIALFAAWYAFRPERLVVNHRVNEGFPVTEGASSAETIESGTFYGVITQLQAPQPSTASRTGVAFFASRTSEHQTGRTFMSTSRG